MLKIFSILKKIILLIILLISIIKILRENILEKLSLNQIHVISQSFALNSKTEEKKLK